MAEYEQRVFTLGPGVSSRHARDVLGIHAEFGDWELLRQAIYEGGLRKVTVRRRVRSEPLPPLPS